MAMACLRLLTLPPLPRSPRLSVPRLRLRMALFTSFEALREYLRAMLPPVKWGHQCQVGPVVPVSDSRPDQFGAASHRRAHSDRSRSACTSTEPSAVSSGRCVAGSCSTLALWPLHSLVNSTNFPLGNSKASW